MRMVMVMPESGPAMFINECTLLYARFDHAIFNLLPIMNYDHAILYHKINWWISGC